MFHSFCLFLSFLISFQTGLKSKVEDERRREGPVPRAADLVQQPSKWFHSSPRGNGAATRNVIKSRWPDGSLLGINSRRKPLRHLLLGRDLHHSKDETSLCSSSKDSLCWNGSSSFKKVFPLVRRASSLNLTCTWLRSIRRDSGSLDQLLGSKATHC